MRAADRLGSGTSFAQARDPRNRAKAQAQGDIPMYDLVTLQLSEVVPTPLNPREHFGSNDELLTLGRSLADTQLTPCVAVPTAAYLKVWPEHADQVSRAKHVLLNGERRWRAAQLADLTTLDFTLRGDLAVIHDGDLQSARARLLDAVLKENIDRQNFDPVEEARGVAALVSVYGDGVRAGQQLKRGKSWVSQRLALLALPQDLQAQVSSGLISIIDGRWMGARAKANPSPTSEQLLDLLREHQEEEQQRKKETEEKRLREAAGFTAVNPPAAPQGKPAASAGPRETLNSAAGSPPSVAPDAASGFTAVNPDGSPEGQESTPKLEPDPRATVVNPRSAADAGRDHERSDSEPGGFTAVNPDPASEPDWADPDSVAAAILRRFSPKDIASIARTLIDAYHESGRTEEATA